MNSNEYKILELMKRLKMPVFFRELSKKSGVSIGGTQQVLKNYSYFIEKKAKGRNTYYSIKNNIESLYLKKIIELRKAQIFLKDNPNLKVFFNYFVKNNIICLVFGSYAKENFNKKSDIDVLVLGDKKFPEHLCPVKVHLINLTKKQFEIALKKKEALINEIIDNHIIINGLDYFVDIL